MTNTNIYINLASSILLASGIAMAIYAGVIIERQEIYDICTTTGELWINEEAFYCVPVVRE